VRETRENGQVIVIFALAIVTLFLFAALAFDTGMMLVERRDQQNAADAAALAGARYLPGDPAKARLAAKDIATANGFTHGIDSERVVINIPPLHGSFFGCVGCIEVSIGSTRPSIFAGVMRVTLWKVDSTAVAANSDDIFPPFAMLALDPTGCEAINIHGNGDVTANGNIWVNSSCSNAALRRQGGGDITVTAANASCNVVGTLPGIKDGGSGSLTCTKNTGAPAMPDPLSDLPAPPVPALPLAPVQVAGTTKPIPDHCPGAVLPQLAPATAADPQVCEFPSPYAGTTWRLYPGYYPGGMQLKAGIFYMEPGIYYLGGGGFQMGGNGASVTSVAPGGTTLGGGIMFYNTEDSVFHTACANGTASKPLVQCIQEFDFNGSAAGLQVYPLADGSTWDGIVIYQDRNLNTDTASVQLNGSASAMQLRGTIYVPSGTVIVSGSAAAITIDQVIAFRFDVTGAPGSTINVANDPNFIFKLAGAGLVE
jgi:hypothetical protein